MGIDDRRTHRNSMVARGHCYIYTARAGRDYFEGEAIWHNKSILAFGKHTSNFIIFIYVYVCAHAHTHMPQCTCMGQRATRRGQFSPSIIWALEMEFRWLCLAASTSASLALLLAPENRILRMLHKGSEEWKRRDRKQNRRSKRGWRAPAAPPEDLG